MLKVSPGEGGSFFNADKRKKQVTLVDPTSGQSSSAEDRRPTVAAPKMFAFDAIFTEEDSQVSVRNSPYPLERGGGIKLPPVIRERRFPSSALSSSGGGQNSLSPFSGPFFLSPPTRVLSLSLARVESRFHRSVSRRILRCRCQVDK